MSGLDPNGGGPLVVPSGGGSLPTPTTPGALLRVNAGATGYEEFMGYLSGHSWERLAASVAGKGAKFFNTDTGVSTVSSGDDTIGWYVEFGGPNLRDTCVLESTSGYVRTTADLTAFALGSTTLAVLFRWDGDTSAPYYFFAALGARPRGIIVGIKSSGTDWLLVCFQGTDSVLATIPKASFATGWHAIAVAAVSHDFGLGAVDAWAWSLDGSAVAYAAMAASYTTPHVDDPITMGATDLPDAPNNGASAEVACWTSALTGAQMAALSTVPGTPTCKLPITSAMGVPEVWIQASRFDPRQPTVCPVRIGHLTVAATASSVTRREY